MRPYLQILLLMLVASTPALAKDAPVRTMDEYVGPVPARSFNDADLKKQLDDLAAAYASGACAQLGKACAPAEEVHRKVFGDLYYEGWPHLLIYYKAASDNTKEHPKVPTLAAAVLIWNGKSSRTRSSR
jgi:hypothetical protein